MVTLRKQEMTVTSEKQPMPIMHRHTLLVIKSAPSFKEGDTVVCFIAKYDNGRYCVFTASFIRIDQYHVFESEAQLHEHFEEKL